jgi:hypothetical protein
VSKFAAGSRCFVVEMNVAARGTLQGIEGRKASNDIKHDSTVDDIHRSD